MGYESWVSSVFVIIAYICLHNKGGIGCGYEVPYESSDSSVKFVFLY